MNKSVLFVEFKTQKKIQPVSSTTCSWRQLVCYAEWLTPPDASCFGASVPSAFSKCQLFARFWSDSCSLHLSPFSMNIQGDGIEWIDSSNSPRQVPDCALRCLEISNSASPWTSWHSNCQVTYARSSSNCSQLLVPSLFQKSGVFLCFLLFANKRSTESNGKSSDRQWPRQKRSLPGIHRPTLEVIGTWQLKSRTEADSMNWVVHTCWWPQTKHYKWSCCIEQTNLVFGGTSLTIPVDGFCIPLFLSVVVRPLVTTPMLWLSIKYVDRETRVLGQNQIICGW